MIYPKTPNRYPNLTPIRFILASLVVIYHVAQFSKNREFPFFDDLAIFHKGNEAVYMFFSLSGFLIIKQLYTEKKLTNSINLKRFYTRRMLRIFPLYYLVLLIGFFYYHVILPNFGFEIRNDYNLFTGLFLSITFFPNIFRTFSPGGILEILWSIGIEEQFYLFVAPVFLIIPMQRIVRFLVLFSILYFGLFFSDHLLFLEKYKMLFFYFSIGGLCSIFLDHQTFRLYLQKYRHLILFLFILYFTTRLFEANFSPLLYHLFGCIWFGITIALFAIKPIKLLQNKALDYLGTISFGIYMYHTIALQFVGLLYLKFISTFGLNEILDILIINIATLAFTLLISHFSYRYYESYFLKLKRKKNFRSETEN